MKSYPNIKKIFNNYCYSSSSNTGTTTKFISDPLTIKHILVLLKVDIDQIYIDTDTKYNYDMFLDLIKTQLYNSDNNKAKIEAKIEVTDLIEGLNNNLNKDTSKYIVNKLFNIKKRKRVNNTYLEEHLNKSDLFDN